MTIVSFERKFVFVHIPKCGGTSIEAEWPRHARLNDLVLTADSDEAHAQSTRRFGLSKHTKFERIEAILGRDAMANWVSCALVRNPLAIVESYFKYGLWMLEDLAQQRGMTASQFRAGAAGKDSSTVPDWVLRVNDGTLRDAMIAQNFDDFLDRVADARWSDYQRRYLRGGAGEVAVKHVLRLEDSLGLKRFFRSRIDRTFEIRHINRAPVGAGIEWSATARRRFLDLTGEEHQLFGYPLR